MIAAADRKLMATQRLMSVSASVARWATRGVQSADSTPGMSSPAKPATTSTPTAISAQSLTMDSNAIAATTPGWLSSAPILRVPNRMTNTAMHAATQKPVSLSRPGGGAVPSANGDGLAIASKLVATAFSCSAM